MSGALAVPFILPMLCTRPHSPGRLSAGGYVAEPKLDGQRVQLHIERGCTVNAYSRSGSDLLSYPGMAFLREITWPVDAAVLDGEAIAGEARGTGRRGAARCGRGSDRTRRRSAVAPVGRRGRRRGHRAEGSGLDVPAQCPIAGVAQGRGQARARRDRRRRGAATDSFRRMGHGAEPQARLPTSAHRGRRRDRAAVRVPWGETFELRPGARAEILCWGVMPSGRLGHPLFSGWVPDSAGPMTRDQISASRRMIAVTGEQVQQSEALMRRSRTILRDSKKAVDWSARAREAQAGPLPPDP